MAETTGIEWCDATLNLWWGCTKVSDGCKFCYAESLADQRFGRNNWGPNGARQEVKSWRATLNKISKRAAAENRRLRVFCQSMSDTFEGPGTMGGAESENWALVSRLRLELLQAIQDHPEMDFLLLTKRPENAATFFAQQASDGSTVLDHLKNIWIGTSVEDQKTADERIPHLLNIPAAVRFLSCEPVLGPVDIDKWLYGRCSRCNGTGGYYDCSDGGQGDEDCYDCEGLGIDYDFTRSDIHWVICGGESGPNARPMHPDWARSLRDQCVAAGVPFFFKQGSQANWERFKDFESLPPEFQVREFPLGVCDDSEGHSNA